MCNSSAAGRWCALRRTGIIPREHNWRAAHFANGLNSTVPIQVSKLFSARPAASLGHNPPSYEPIGFPFLLDWCRFINGLAYCGTAGSEQPQRQGAEQHH